MKHKTLKPVTPGMRHRTPKGGSRVVTRVKSLRRVTKNHAGRNNSGKVTVRHQGGREKRFLRIIDFKRTIKDIPARVASIEYDPNRTADIALLFYRDGRKSYILAPDGMKVDQVIMAGPSAEIEPGNALPLKNIPIGTPIHNLEITPKKGGQLVRSAGNAAYIQAKEDNIIDVKLPSGEVRQFKPDCYATVGQVSNTEHRNRKLGKAGIKRHMGIRPTVRGVAQDPRSHPHGGGEGRSGIGMKSPKSPWGKRTLGRRTRKRSKYSNKVIIKSRKAK